MIKWEYILETLSIIKHAHPNLKTERMVFKDQLHDTPKNSKSPDIKGH
jgi:hypothetical protein